MTPPSKIMQSYLVQEGIVSNPSDESDWPAYISILPEDSLVPTNAIGIIDTAGEKDGRLMSGEVIYRSGLQILLRAADYQTGWDKCQELVGIIDSINNSTIAIGTDEYKIYCATRTSDMLPIGEDDNRNMIFSINFLINYFRGIYTQYDPDAKLYFDREEAWGTSFDLTSIDASLTESAVKSAHDTLVRGLKADGTWDKLKMIMLFCGKKENEAAYFALKYPSIPQVSYSSYIPAGTDLGNLIISSSQLRAFSDFADLGINESTGVHLGFYLNYPGLPGPVPTSIFRIEHFNGTKTGFYQEYDLPNPIKRIMVYAGSSDEKFVLSAARQHMILTRRSNTEAEAYVDGSSQYDFTEEVSGTLFWNSASIFSFGDPTNRIPFIHAGTKLTDTEAQSISNRFNTFIKALGADGY